MAKSAATIEAERVAAEERAAQEERDRKAAEAQANEERIQRETKAEEARQAELERIAKEREATDIQNGNTGGGTDPASGVGGDTLAPSDKTEVARVDGVDITRANQRLVSPEDHGRSAPPFLSIANLPAGSEPTAIDLSTGLPKARQTAESDAKRLADLKDSE